MDFQRCSSLRLRGLFVISFLCLAVWLPFGQVLGKSGDKAPVTITFHNPFGDVLFSHDQHNKISCSQCHPPFDFKFREGKGYSLRAHELCISCHNKSSLSTECKSCHQIHERNKKAFDPEVMKTEDPNRQKVMDMFFKRRSIRKFQDKPVPDDVIRDILKSGMASPSAGSWQPWMFVVVKDVKLKEDLSKTSPFAGFIKDSPVVICVAGRKDNHWSPFDCALASGSILLAAANLDLGATYCGLDKEREGKARKVLGIPDRYFLYAFIPMGYPAEVKKPHTKYNPERIYWNRFEEGRPESVVGE